MFRHEHSEPLLKNLTDSKHFRLYWILGRLNDSLELTVKADGRKIDMFYVYENATREQNYVAGMRVDVHQQMRWYYPKITGICTGDLLNKLMYMPCNALELIKASA